MTRRLNDLYDQIYKAEDLLQESMMKKATLESEQMHTTLKKYNTAFTVTTAENKKLKKKTEQLEQSLDKATQESTLKKLADAKLHRDYEDAVAVLDRIPKEVLEAYTQNGEREGDCLW